jgi:hypothetical protein
LEREEGTETDEVAENTESISDQYLEARRWSCGLVVVLGSARASEINEDSSKETET